MPAGGFRTFIAGEVLDENDINDYLMQGMLVFAGTAARGTAIGTAVTEGMFTYLADSNTVEYYDGSAWVEFQGGVSSPTMTGGNGTVTSGGYTYHVFSTSGSAVITDPGVVDVLIIGGGGGGGRGKSSPETGGGGGAGEVSVYTNYYLPAGTVTAVIGAGGAGGAGSTNSTTSGVQGTNSTFGQLLGIWGGGGFGEEGGGNSSHWIGASSGGNASTSGSPMYTAVAIRGNIGGTGIPANGAGGGGGAGAAGSNSPGSDTGGAGGAGTTAYSAWLSAITSLMTGVTNWGTATSGGAIGGGGGGGGDNTPGAGGTGGGGVGGGGGNLPASGTANTGGGGGGSEATTGGSGGSGLVVVRYAV